MSQAKLLVTQYADEVMEIRLNRPELHNAFDEFMIGELSEAFFEIGNRKDIRAIVLSGEGKSFCAGADLNWMKKMKDYTLEENFEDSLKLAKMLDAIDQVPVPVIGRIHGAALGGGVGLTAVCDHVVASESALFGLTEVRLGLVPAVISPYVISKIGTSMARSLFLTGKRFNAQEALSYGLVHQVVASSEMDKTIRAYIDELKMAAPNATRVAKKLVRYVSTHQHDPQMLQDYTCKTISQVRISDEGQEGMSSLLDKRKPKWHKENS